MNKFTQEISTKLPITYFYEKRNSEKLLIFLHGYTDSASAFLRKTYDDDLGLDYLAPNGPFPVPVRTDQGFKEAFSWYFEDHSIKRILIPKQVSIQIIKELLKELNIQDQPKMIIGYSQGGFLAPILARELSHVEKIIGIGCGYPEASYEHLKNLKVYGIHGVLDEVVNYENSKKEFSSLLNTGGSGEWTSIRDMHHSPNDEVKKILKNYINL